MATVATTQGFTGSMYLSPGTYTATLTVTDSLGQSSAATKAFYVGDQSQYNALVAAGMGAAGVTNMMIAGTPDASAAAGAAGTAASGVGGAGGAGAAASSSPRPNAVIAQPAGFVTMSEAGTTPVQLSAAGSAATPGAQLVGYTWLVLRLPDEALVADFSGVSGSVPLPVGSYGVLLNVQDSTGANSTAAKEFQVGNSNGQGLVGVITWPPGNVQARDTGTTTVALDASGSSAANGSTVDAYIWAVISLPDRKLVANATGRVSTLQLPAGAYQAGLLVMASTGASVTVRKNFNVGTAPVVASAVVNSKPIVGKGLNFTAYTNSSFRISGVADPDGDNVTLRWTLMNNATGDTKSGGGWLVSLAGVKAGKYLMIINADDGRAGVTTGTAALRVKAAKASSSPKPSPSPSTSSSSISRPLSTSSSSSSAAARSPPPRPPPPRSPPPSPRPSPPPPRSPPPPPPQQLQQLPQQTAQQATAGLPNIMLPSGARLMVDASVVNLLPIGSVAKSYQWVLSQQKTGLQVSSVSMQVGTFVFNHVDVYILSLTLTATNGKVYKASSTVVVTAAAKSSTAASAVSITGSCGPFSSQQYSSKPASCPGLVASKSGVTLAYAWRVTNQATGQSVASTGAQPVFGSLNPGKYTVQLMVGPGQTVDTTTVVHYTVTSLIIASASTLELQLPKSACAGVSVTFAAPKLTVPASAAVEYIWTAAWKSDGQASLRPSVVTGQGASFSLMPQPGTYSITLVATVRGAAATKLTGQGGFVAAVCSFTPKCKSVQVRLNVSETGCAVAPAQAKELLQGLPPAGFSATFAPGANTSIGRRAITVVVVSSSSSSRAATASNSCTAPDVVISDVTAPQVVPVKSGGACMGPANGNWYCYTPQELVKMSDNCQGVKAKMAFSVSCGSGTTPDNCRVSSDGKAGCLRAVPVLVTSRTPMSLKVAMRDGSGNVAGVVVPVAVRAKQMAGCEAPQFTRPL